MTCPAPETAAAWLQGELSDAQAEAFEQHYFECAACFERARRLEHTLLTLAECLPFTLTRARREALVARRALPVVDVKPGEQATLRLDAEQPAALWVMHFTASSVERVDLEARAIDGQLLLGLKDIACDLEQGRVYMPCQLHYRDNFPGETTLVVRLTSPDLAGGERELGRYILDHQFISP
jgi:hypothetical protein